MKAGDTALAFHPMMMGVVLTATVKRVGRRYVYLDFGQIRGGEFKVLPGDVVEVLPAEPAAPTMLP